MSLPIEAYKRIDPPQEQEEWPKPLVEATAVGRDEYSSVRAVMAMVKYAEEHGWTVLVTKAKGAYPSIGGKPSRQRWSYAVRMAKGSGRAVAIYVEGVTKDGPWKWDLLITHGHGRPLVTYSLVESFKRATA